MERAVTEVTVMDIRIISQVNAGMRRRKVFIIITTLTSILLCFYSLKMGDVLLVLPLSAAGTLVHCGT